VVDDLQRRLVELRFVEGIEKVEHVPYPTGDQFWVRFNSKLDVGKFEDIAKKHGYVIVRFASLPSKLPRPIAEILWNGISHVITKKINGWAKFTASIGFEPDGVAKIATDLHGPYQIYISMQEEGIQMLYEYLGLKYTAPVPPPKPVTPAKPAVTTAVKPSPAAPRPVTPPTPVTAKPTPPTQPAQTQPPQEPKAQGLPKPTAPVVEQNKKDGSAQPTG
jgi:hypothetical protein